MMVVERIVNSIFPKRAPANYLKLNLGTNPDLYGPFWIVVTLIFTIAISGNIANYLQHASTDYHWRYNFHLVSIAASSIIFYVCFVPCALWGILKWSAKTEEEDTIDPDAETVRME
jgi:protein YIPF1/2